MGLQISPPGPATSVASRRDQMYRVVSAFQERTIDLATGGGTTYEEWEESRVEVLSQPELLHVLPEWVSRTRWGGQFWQFIKGVDATYAGRRKFIWDQLEPVFQAVEKGGTQQTSLSLEPFLAKATASSIADAWSRIQARREADPEGAITLARSLLEGTCKELLHKLRIEYGDSDDLPKLYGQLAKAMNLGPQAHKEEVFKQILSGCFSVVNGLAALRNAFGDAHGKGPNAPRPGGRHADLAINLSGSLATFLMATFEERHSNSDTSN